MGLSSPRTNADKTEKKILLLQGAMPMESQPIIFS
jgi:hypothetical protein